MSDVESQLRAKISSKLTVATFLAGFTFAALLELLMNRSRFEAARTIVPVRVAVVSLTLALALFISAVYMYDRLSMPREFWKYQPHSGSNGKKTFLEKLHFKVHSESAMASDGALYTYMIGVWQWVFTPAVISAFVGFSAILYSIDDRPILWTGIGVIFAVFIYYIVLRPILGKID
jgi:hypothetical protein